VYFRHKLRDEHKFASPEELIKQMNSDAASARRFFADRRTNV
jgi:FAD synthase